MKTTKEKNKETKNKETHENRGKPLSRYCSYDISGHRTSLLKI